MLRVNTYLDKSTIPGAGKGLFTSEDIKKGSVVWAYDQGKDMRFSPKAVKKLGKDEQEFIYHFAYLSARSGMYVLCGDDARFYNHSDTPNVDTHEQFDGDEFVDLANRDIMAGEELFCDYRRIDKRLPPF